MLIVGAKDVMIPLDVINYPFATFAKNVLCIIRTAEKVIIILKFFFIPALLYESQ
jgi:hypothetical protein